SIVTFTTNANITQYMDLTVNPDSTYCYTISSISGNYISPSSSAVCVITPNTCKYILDTRTDCQNGKITYSLSSDTSICNVIAYDFTLLGDPNILDFSSLDIKVNPSMGLLQSMIDFDTLTFTSNPNQINVIIYLTASAGTNTFCGVGEVFEIEFNLLDTIQNTSTVQITNFLEGMTTQALPYCVETGMITTINLDSVRGRIQYFDNGDIIHDNSIQPTYLVGANDENGTNQTSLNLIPNSPEFNYDVINNGNYLKIVRDINNSTAVLPIIGGAHTLRIKQLALGHNQIGIPSSLYSPSVIDLIRADVNNDGVITASDVTLNNQRAVLIIGEYPGGRDWKFMDSITLASFQLSSTFPDDDGVGISRFSIPNINDFMEIHKQGEFCQEYPFMTYTGWVPGSYSSFMDLTSYRIFSTDTVFFDIDNVTWNNGVVSIPVYIVSNDDIYTLDFSSVFDSLKSTFSNINFPSSSLLSNFDGAVNTVNNTLYVANFATSSYPTSAADNPLLTIDLNVPSGTNFNNAINCLLENTTALINGNPVAQADTLNALSTVTVNGMVTDEAGVKLNNF
ncbi:MAG: hypothetical protein AB8G11_23770, partial [Saprospiraceae bacterium]